MEVARRVGVAVDFSACSKKALKWALDNVVRDGDHLIILSVLPEGHYEEGEMQLWETTGSRTFLSFFSLRASFSISVMLLRSTLADFQIEADFDLFWFYFAFCFGFIFVFVWFCLLFFIFTDGKFSEFWLI